MSGDGVGQWFGRGRIGAHPPIHAVHNDVDVVSFVEPHPVFHHNPRLGRVPHLVKLALRERS